MRMLITGVTGFVGSHLAEYLIGHGDEVIGIKRWRSPMDNLDGVSVKLLDGDLTDPGSTRSCVDIASPSVIYHLAAQSYVPFSYEAPRATMEANVIGTLNLLEAIRNRGEPYPRVILVTSSEVYGDVEEAICPIDEDTRMLPVSPYGVSKAAADLLGYSYFVSYGIPIVRLRNFTTSGAGRGRVFFDSSWCWQIAQMEIGKQRPDVLHVGNLDSVRTVMHVRDLVRGYALAVDRCAPGEAYNIGGSETYQLREIVEMLRPMTEVKFTIEEDPDLMRPADVTNQKPNRAKFQKATGWQPTIPYQEALDDMLHHWRLDTEV